MKRGFTLLEVIISLLVLGIVFAVISNYVAMTFNYTSSNQDISFANVKTNQIIEELKSYIRKGEEKRAEYLDNFDDGTSYNPVLTTTKDATPEHILSGNSKLADGSWRFYRKITVRKLPNVESRDVRYVTVEMFKKTGDSYRKLSEISTIISTMGSPDIPQQVYDMYLIAIENIPGWWVNTTNLRMMVDSSISEIAARNPNLTIRTHWITRLSYGRDEYYRPYINKTNPVSSSIPWAYIYPGLLNNSNQANSVYYDTNFIKGKLNIDGTPNSGTYALADQFNHSMRYPDELARYNYEKQKNPDLEPSWRMLMEDLFSNPDKYKNSIIINLHGELMPFPPLRNYSDPAKDPENYPGVRVVTHPENLKYNNETDDVKLRVYAYLMPNYSSPSTVDNITILLRGINNTSAVENVQVIKGNSNTEYTKTPAATPSDYETRILYKEGSPIGVKILLKNTPTSCPPYNDPNDTSNITGLPDSQKLYELQYIPCPVNGQNWQDLTVSGDIPKNTARWIITLDGEKISSDNNPLTIETYIGNKGASDIPDPTQYTPNRSRTYTWIGGIEPPITESFQFMGDPRYCPYLDVKKDDRYNRYFTNSLSGYSGFTGYNGWNGVFDSDIPRYFQVFRDGILRSSSIFNSVTGFSFYYVGFGQEIGGDSSNAYINNLLDNPISGLPWGTTGTTKVDEIIPDDGANQSYCRLIKGSNWYSRIWLGELYPDSQYNNWKNNGNLTAPTFYREKYSSLGYSYDRYKRTSHYGPPTALNANSGSGCFNHEHKNDNTNTATLTDAGKKINEAFNMVLPESMDARRPFALNATTVSGSNPYPPEWDGILKTYRGTLSFYKTYYNASFNSSYNSSVLLKLNAKTLANDTKTGYFLINGLSPAGDTGTAFIARYAIVSTIMGFLDAGNPANPDRIEQVPYITITFPTETEEINDPPDITIQWTTEWKRWDGKNYSDYTYTNPPSVIYAVKYSTDGGKTWKYVQDDKSTSTGERPDDDTHTIEPDDTSYTLSTPANKFPIGTYIFMVEAFRRDIPNHYAFHQRRVFIRR
ncbi:MAG TPA: prepilin-type N-terminal cleavage/methylation domain-containing protein [bacterium]|jgi:prepilin-type N-terminal cleavage/methylation domain-containing protein|nr:prepilin-type N-terminal cleavage/methylation domain-containing protein [bacterium]